MNGLLKYFAKNRKIIFFAVSALFLVCAFFLVPNQASAQTSSFLANIGIGVVTKVFEGAAYIFNLIFGFFFMLASWLVEIAMKLNNSILSDSNAVVKIGWSISRDIANLGFVLIMIIIAVATIVRYEKYSAKLLPVLIGAAILVNFSLTIGGVFIKFSDTVAGTFSSKLNAGDIKDAVAGAFNPQKLLLKDNENPTPPDPASQSSGFSDFSATVLISIASLIFQIVFLALAAFSMAALALMLFYRYVALSLLFVLAPIVWMFWVFPDLHHHFTSWWNAFLKWVFFLPASTFFLYLAVETASGLKNSGIFSGNIFTASGFAEIMGQGAQMIVLCFLLWGGLYVANKMGIEGASGAMTLAGKAKNSALGAAGKYARTRAGNVGRRLLTGGVNEKGETRLERFGAKFGKLPVLGAVATGVSGISSRAKTASNKALEEAQKNVDNRTADDAVNILNRQITGGRMMPDAELAAWGIKAAKEGKWGNIKDDETRNRIIESVKRTNSKDKILGYVPQEAQKFGITEEKALAKYVQDASKLAAEVLGKPDASGHVLSQSKDVVINLRSSHITQIANNGTDDQKQAVVDTINNTLGPKLITGIDDAFNRINTAKSSGNAANLQAAQDALKLVLTGMIDEEKKAYNVYKNIKNNVNW